MGKEKELRDEMTWGWTDFFFFSLGAGGRGPELTFHSSAPNPPVHISHYILYYQPHSYPTVLMDEQLERGNQEWRRWGPLGVVDLWD